VKYSTLHLTRRSLFWYVGVSKCVFVVDSRPKNNAYTHSMHSSTSRQPLSNVEGQDICELEFPVENMSGRRSPKVLQVIR